MKRFLFQFRKPFETATDFNADYRSLTDFLTAYGTYCSLFTKRLIQRLPFFLLFSTVRPVAYIKCRGCEQRLKSRHDGLSDFNYESHFHLAVCALSCHRIVQKSGPGDRASESEEHRLRYLNVRESLDRCCNFGDCAKVHYCLGRETAFLHVGSIRG